MVKESVPPIHCGWLREKRTPELIKILKLFCLQLSKMSYEFSIKMFEFTVNNQEKPIQLL